MSSHPPFESQAPAANVRRCPLPRLLVYPVLGIPGELTHRQILPLLALPDRWAAAWQHVGGYRRLAVAFALDYGCRRGRHFSHTAAHTMPLNLVKRWPGLMHRSGAPAHGMHAKVAA